MLQTMRGLCFFDNNEKTYCQGLGAGNKALVISRFHNACFCNNDVPLEQVETVVMDFLKQHA